MDYTQKASRERVEGAIRALVANGMNGEFIETKEKALERIKELIPKGASVMNGASKTLEQIGYVEYLKAKTHGWNNLHDAILNETDAPRQAELRKQSVLSDYYLGSVHAATEDGHLVVASNSGSQLPHIVYTSPNLILVVGTHKLTPTLQDGLNRLREYVYPLEDARMMEKYGKGSQLSKIVVLNKENPMLGRDVKVLFVDEVLGF